MSAGSFAPQVKDDLVTALEARPDLNGLLIERSTPNGNPDHPVDTTEAIWIGRDNSQDVDIEAVPKVMVGGGRMVLDETFIIWLTIFVLLDTKDGTQKAAQDRAYELMGEVVGCVCSATLGPTAPTADGKFYGVQGVVAQESGVELDSGGSGCVIEVGFTCAGRLTLT